MCVSSTVDSRRGNKTYPHGGGRRRLGSKIRPIHRCCATQIRTFKLFLLTERKDATKVEAIAIRVEAIATSYKKLLERKITFFHPSCQSGFKGLSMRGRWKIH